MEQIFHYTDFRKFLADFYDAQKAENPHFTHRHVAKQVGFKSSGFFAQVLSGASNISKKLIPGFARLMKLNPKESKYFRLMVLFNQAKPHAQKKKTFEEMLAFNKTHVKTLDPNQYEFFDKWYYLAIRELLNFYPFHGNFNVLATMVEPSIRPHQAKKAVKLLEKLGMIQKQDDGSYKLTNALLSTGQPENTVAINNFQLKTLNLAKEAIDRFPKNERSISTLTLSMSGQAFQKVEERLAIFRREMMDIIKNDPNPVCRVYQYNFQIFPLTKRYKDNTK